LVAVDKEGKEYQPCATNADKENWTYWLYDIPTNLFPFKQIKFVRLPLLNSPISPN
jgi:hypothetical protein